VGASPDLRTQIMATQELWPCPEIPRHSPILGVFLTSSDVDAVMGLLHLREFQSFFVFATPRVQHILKNENSILHVLDRAEPPVQWQAFLPDQRVGCHLSHKLDAPPTFFYTAISLGPNYPDYASADSRKKGPSDQACVGFLIEQENKKLFVAPSISGHNLDWTKLVASADMVLLDGTFWSDEELVATGRTKKSAREMGHLPLSGPDGLLAQYPKDAQARKILIHINNTNPILDENSEEHHTVVDAGFEIAYDGLSLSL
jgi:pyrroloquinoline quinone biosynthesis protein B